MYFSYYCVFVLLIFLDLHHTYAYEFCRFGRDTELCPLFPNTRHFMCEPESIEPHGEYLAHYPMTKKMVRTFLESHNELRDKVASGTEQYDGKGFFPKAARMRELIWDDELAYIAHVHASRCNMTHDHCRNTKRFPYAGQNLGFFASNSKQTAKTVIDATFEGFYVEKDLVPDGTAMAKQYTSTYTATMGHFTQLMNDQVSRVGCAMAYCANCASITKKNKINKHCYYITCNYDGTNIREVPVYQLDLNESGSNCSNWKTVKSTKYPNLCASTGEIFETELPPIQYYD